MGSQPGVRFWELSEQGCGPRLGRASWVFWLPAKRAPPPPCPACFLLSSVTPVSR